jgi:hypothetical protein
MGISALAARLPRRAVIRRAAGAGLALNVTHPGPQLRVGTCAI